MRTSVLSMVTDANSTTGCQKSNGHIRSRDTRRVVNILGYLIPSGEMWTRNALGMSFSLEANVEDEQHGPGVVNVDFFA